MNKTVKFGDIFLMGNFFMNKEADIFGGTKLNAKSIYSALKLKKAVLEKFSVAQETVMTLAKSHGATEVEGGLKVPEENLQQFNNDHSELMNENVSLDYDPIHISADSECDVAFMEVFFDFIEIID